ncbi:MAG: hypothetical protein EHM24_29400, partial [Acidobacteria bacterium]
MATKSAASERAESFLETSGQFRLGALVTESSHPRSKGLSQSARASVADGLAILFDIDRDVVAAYEAWSRSPQPGRVAAAVLNSLRRGGRVFFTGCGATGRLSIQLDAIWRAFWQQYNGVGGERAAETWEDRTRSVMAGGDYALIKSVEGFEDLVSFGRKQIADLGVGPDDVVLAITEGGETSFVIGTAWQGLEAGARVFFVYNNPDEVLRAHVRRSRDVIDEPRIEKINLTTGPMAITGSTRMQATSIELAAMLTILEMVLRSLLGDESLAARGVAGAGAVPAEMREGLEAVQTALASHSLRSALAALVEAEEATYRSGARMSYLAGALGIDVLTDTTERSPTFCTPSFKKWDDERAADSWSFLFTPVAATADAWPALLRRSPQTIEWSDEDLERLLDPDTARRQSHVLREIGHSELMRFRIGLDGLASRPVRRGDGVTLVSAAADLHLLEPASATFAALMAAAREAGAGTSMVAVGTADQVARLRSSAAGAAADRVVGLAVPGTPFLLDPLSRVGVKMLLNALSTCTMVRLGGVLGKRMIWVVPCNLKLIDRST